MLRMLPPGTRFSKACADARHIPQQIADGSAGNDPADLAGLRSQTVKLNFRK
jgi:hypothetical protein